jgi:hypothetical protein
MALPNICRVKTPFDLGFEHGADSDEEPSTLELSSRVHEYKLGFILGRSFSASVKHTSHALAAVTAGALGHRYGISVDDVLCAMRLTVAHEQSIRQAYSDADPQS